MNYNELKISKENYNKEMESFEKIKKCIDEEKSWIFDSGAGAGKTYALIETLKYIMIKKERQLKFNNQKIICITYTNVAADEIKQRLGKTQLVDVSTIHEYIWKTIGSYKKLLVNQHKNYLEKQIKENENKLLSLGVYTNLNENEINILKEVLSNNIKEYNRIKNSNKKDFFCKIEELGITNKKLINSKATLKETKDILNCLSKISIYEKTISYIKEEKEGYTQVKYDARFNYDRLDRMYISHDTLLKYADAILDRSNVLKQIICDRNPFILIDEFQDTSEDVVKFFDKLLDYSKKISHPFSSGYYGDIKQNIYNTGIGNKMDYYSTKLERITKIYNRRCSPEIINVGNMIRNDHIKQESIYNSFPESEIIFLNKADREEIIEYLSERWSITKDNKLHCFELKNEIVAENSGFKEFYDFFKKSGYYSGSNYSKINEETMNNDLKKMGRIQSLLYRIIDFKLKISNENTLLSEILVNYRYPFSTIKNMINKMRELEGKNFKEYLNNFFDLRNSNNDIRKIIDYVLIEDIKSYDDLRNFICNILYRDDEEIDQDNINKIDDFFEMDMTVFDNWYNFIKGINDKTIEYHTYHSTKGKEFDNVVIFMSKGFGRDKDYFSNLIDHILQDNKLDDKKIEQARNLFYVVVTRATKNLCVVYLDLLTNIQQSNLEKIFHSIYHDLI